MDSILKQPHGPIYVSCDGPTMAYARQCEEVRQYVSELLRVGVIQNLRISEINEGTLIGVSKGIDWFFDSETTGVIFEDDLVLEPRLLEAVEKSLHHLTDSKVLSIGLFNSVPQEFISDCSKVAHLSRFVVSCGCVTTRDAWNSRLISFQNVGYWKLFIYMAKVIGPSSALYHQWFYWGQLRQEKKDPRHCNRDDLWQINAFVKNKVVIAFNRNMITNIGNGEGSTHTFGESLYSEIIPVTELEFNSLVFWGLPHQIDSVAEKSFLAKRKIGKILRAKVRIRTRLGLR